MGKGEAVPTVLLTAKTKRSRYRPAKSSEVSASVSFPVAVAKYSGKSNISENGFVWLTIAGDGRGSGETDTLHPQSRAGSKGLVQSTDQLTLHFIQFRGSTQGMVPPTIKADLHTSVIKSRQSLPDTLRD